MSLNRCEQRVFEYLESHRDEGQFWREKVRRLAKKAADDHAAARMHGLLAYEKRVVDAQEWPFDQSTLVRVGASALILTVPWFGQAIAQYVVEHLSHG